MAKKIRSVEGPFGTVTHYDEKGKKSVQVRLADLRQIIMTKKVAESDPVTAVLRKATIT